MARRYAVLLVMVALLGAALACNMPTAPTTADGTPTGALDLLTLAAQTAQAGQPILPTSTLADAQTATQSSLPTSGGPATDTPIPPTSTPQPCDQAQFIQDVTISDGTKLIAGQAFRKTWRLRNVGTCTWNSRYALVFASGDAMGAPAITNLPGDVPPNATVDLNLDMKAPTKLGKVESNWKLRNPAGVIFGVFGDQPFFVQIEVVAPTATPAPATVTPPPSPTTPPVPSSTPLSGVVYDFTANACTAQWRSQAGILACPGSTIDINGLVTPLTNPKLETGLTETNPVLLTVPDPSAAGAITGQYAAINVQAGTHFQAGLGCLVGVNQCSVVYQVNGIINGAAPVNLGQWEHKYSSSLQMVDVDLSSLAGQPVQIILAVINKGPANQAQAVWVAPRLVKP